MYALLYLVWRFVYTLSGTYALFFGMYTFATKFLGGVPQDHFAEIYAKYFAVAESITWWQWLLLVMAWITIDSTIDLFRHPIRTGMAE